MSIVRRGAFARDDRVRPESRQRWFFDEVRANDVYLVSFPRSGNTYLRHMLAALLTGDEPTPIAVQALVPDIHWEQGRSRPERDVVMAKTHAPPRDVEARIVYIVRDGRDALLSYYFYLQARGRPTPAAPADMLSWPNTWPCSWIDHVQGWLTRLEGNDHSLVLRYEDLLAEPLRHLTSVAAFTGLDYPEQALATAVERSSLQRMRSAEKSGGRGSLNFVGTSRPDWVKTFRREDLCGFEASCGPLLSRLGYRLVCPDDQGGG